MFRSFTRYGEHITKAIQLETHCYYRQFVTVKCKPSSRTSLRDTFPIESNIRLLLFHHFNCSLSRYPHLFCLISYRINFLVPSNLVTIYTVSLQVYVHAPTMDEISYFHRNILVHDALGLNPLCTVTDDRFHYAAFCQLAAKEPFQRIFSYLTSARAKDNHWNTVTSVKVVSVPVYRILNFNFNSLRCFRLFMSFVWFNSNH
jgi:hypothetical protein